MDPAIFEVFVRNFRIAKIHEVVERIGHQNETDDRA
jgi:hypothetical protein